MLRLNRTGKGSQNNHTLAYNGMGIGSNSRSSHNYPTSSNIVSLNLAYNNISMIEQSFFQTVETVLKVCKNQNLPLSTMRKQNELFLYEYYCNIALWNIPDFEYL